MSTPRPFVSSLTASLKPSASTTSDAPAALAISILSSVPTTAMVRAAPHAGANRSVDVPMPPAAPCTSTVSPSAQPAAGAQRVMHGQVVEQQTRARLERHVVGQFEHPVRLQRNDFGHAAVEHRQAGDPVALRESAVGRRAAHHARDLGARHERQVRPCTDRARGIAGRRETPPPPHGPRRSPRCRRWVRPARRAPPLPDRRGEVSELRASPHLTASGERGFGRLTVVSASYAERSAGQAQRCGGSPRPMHCRRRAR